jgi:hypothetical protein
MLIIAILGVTLLCTVVFGFSKIYFNKDKKRYRKQFGGIWYYVEYTYKRDMGMNRITEFEWVTEKQLESVRLRDNFKIHQTEDYS